MSGNVNVGFIDGRVHNRVLKPPGGGYSEIFFTSNEEQTPKKAPPARSESLIESILRTEDVSPTKNSHNKSATEIIEKKLEEVKIEESQTVKTETQVAVTEQVEKEVKVETIEENKEEQEKGSKDEMKIEDVKEDKVDSSPIKPNNTPSTPEVRKGRVPPGGFSSGLW